MPVTPRKAAPTGTGFVTALRRYIGVPYEWGGSSPSGFDCSGLVEYTLTRLGVPGVPRTSEQQYAWVEKVSYRAVTPGTLIFMNFPGETSPGHVMVASRPGYVIQAPAPGQAVQEVPFTPLAPGSSEWGGTIVGYGRAPGLSYPRNRVGARALPPRPGDPNSPDGTADPAAAANDAASSAWGDYADELHAEPTPGASSNVSLHFFGIPIPGTDWYPSWLDPGSTLGVPGLGSWNPLNYFDQAASAVTDAASFFHWIAWIFSPRNVLRIVEFLAGAALVLVGLSFARRDVARSSSSAGPSRFGTAVRQAWRATPIGREAALAKAATRARRDARHVRQAGRAARHAREESKTYKRVRAESRGPAESREQHRARRAKQKREGEVPF